MRTAIINFYENGRLRVLDCESLVQSLTSLIMVKRLYSGEKACWKCYLNHLLKPYRGSFLLYSDYGPQGS